MKTYKDFLFEKVGVNQEVIKLSDFISKYIHDKGKVEDTYVIMKNEIPDDIDLPINKLTIEYKPVFDRKKTKKYGHLDPYKSKRFKSGNVEIHMMIRTLKKSVLYHEVNHALQFIKLGRSKMVEKMKISFLYQLKKYFNDEKIQNFLYFLYRADENEMYSNIIQFYGQLKGLMKKYIKKFRLEGTHIPKEELDDIIDKWKRDYFRDTLLNRDIYLTAKFIEKINLEEFFKDADDEEVDKLFSLLSTVEIGGLNKIKFKVPFSIISYLFKSHSKEPILDVEILSDKEIKSEMKKYQDILNKNGKKMRTKLTKIWYLLEDL